MTKVQRSFVDHPNFILETLRDVAGKCEWEFDSSPKDFRARSEWGEAYCLFLAKPFHARFAVQQMPGCCAVLILHHVETEPYTHEIFDNVLQAIIAAAFQAGFGSLMMAQVVGRRGPEAEIWANCATNGWVISKPFINAKSGNSVVYLTFDLKQPGKRQGLEFEIPDKKEPDAAQ